MTTTFEEASKTGMEAAMKSAVVFSKGLQDLAKETSDFSRQSFDVSQAAFEKLLDASSLDEAIDVQTQFAKSSYDGFVAEASKVGELYSNLVKEVFKVARPD